eukprot:CAMPEP_0117016482 /NCGR_PEP_ID=MMETSP0472-20121206/12992_1 /TAXON_ID=693140 ORGANISM="Tiarina fusus, Strain LIS" /NCGR_SAMPLE_ID=MMETSP0472 /ASSEMBLY_ACC=CAM_ASM_000603 /LENGTH=455 /DNA_ID=CAMNT_0004720555 /DNA_START=126 /DNA_END=1493 /DNA_ORIENTATION=+
MSTTDSTATLPDVWVNNMNKTAIEKTRRKMKQDESLGGNAPVTVTATWENGLVTGAGGKLVCYPAPEIQLASLKMGPSVNSYCPLIAGGCFSLVIMIQAAIKDYKFESFTTNMKTNPNFIGCYKQGQGSVGEHPWVDHGIRLNMTIQGPQTTDELVRLSDKADRHCPSSEIMKRDFPVEVEKFEFKNTGDDAEWADVPVWYDMKKYNEIAEKSEHFVEQNADMVWHCQNENERFPDSLMSFEFPSDCGAKLVLSHDKPLSSGKYANPVQACFFGGLSSFLHTVAARLYVRGYKVERIEGAIKSVLNKRKVFAVEKSSYVFPEGATIEIVVWTNAPKSVIEDVKVEAEEMSPTMMNWRNELPLEYAIYRKAPSGKPYGSGGPEPIEPPIDKLSVSEKSVPKTFEFDLKESGVRKGGMPLTRWMKKIFGRSSSSKSKSGSSRAGSSISSSGFSDNSF